MICPRDVTGLGKLTEAYLLVIYADGIVQGLDATFPATVDRVEFQ